MPTGLTGCPGEREGYHTLGPLTAKESCARIAAWQYPAQARSWVQRLADA